MESYDVTIVIRNELDEPSSYSGKCSWRLTLRKIKKVNEECNLVWGWGFVDTFKTDNHICLSYQGQME